MRTNVERHSNVSTEKGELIEDFEQKWIALAEMEKESWNAVVDKQKSSQIQRIPFHCDGVAMTQM